MPGFVLREIHHKRTNTFISWTNLGSHVLIYFNTS